MIISRFLAGRFRSDYRATIGADFIVKQIEIDNTAVSLQIWDTAGQERFRSLGVAFYRGSDAGIIVFDKSVYSTFQNVESFYNSLKSDLEELPLMFLVGNKSDCPAAVSRDEIHELALRLEMTYVETSALNNENIETLFTMVGKGALAKNLDS